MAHFQLVGAQAIKVLARIAARNAVKDQLRGAGARVSHIREADIQAQASEYLTSHPELFDHARERAVRMGLIERAEHNS